MQDNQWAYRKLSSTAWQLTFYWCLSRLCPAYLCSVQCNLDPFVDLCYHQCGTESNPGAKPWRSMIGIRIWRGSSKLFTDAFWMLCIGWHIRAVAPVHSRHIFACNIHIRLSLFSLVKPWTHSPSSQTLPNLQNQPGTKFARSEFGKRMIQSLSASESCPLTQAKAVLAIVIIDHCPVKGTSHFL